MTEKLIEIRASGLPNAMDCQRRWAGQLALDPKSNFMPVLQKHGYVIERRGSGNNIGNLVGSAAHEGFGMYFQAKIDGYNFENIEQQAITKLRKDLSSEANLEDIFDKKITKDQATAEEQLKRIVAVYAPYAETVQPKRVEFALESRPDPLKPYIITGHPDRYDQSDDVHDMKFGSHCGPYEAQLGAYSLMMRSNGMPTRGLFVDWVPRKSIGARAKPLKLEVIEYDKFAAENAAHHMIDETMTRIEKFKETGNPWAFTANPNSNLCAKKWCSLWGTPMCDLGRPEKSSSEDE